MSEESPQFKTRASDFSGETPKNVKDEAVARRRRERKMTFAVTLAACGIVSFGVSRVSEIQGSNESSKNTQDLCKDFREVVGYLQEGSQRIVDETEKLPETKQTRLTIQRQGDQVKNYKRITESEGCAARFPDRNVLPWVD